MMRKILFCFLVNVFAFKLTYTQQVNRFAYIQTDNKQPFYIKWNNKVWSSSTTGYLILSKIQEPQISFVIGFPRNLYPEQSFLITFNGSKDAGYLLKEFGDKGWGLYNLQTLAVVYATKEIVNPAKEAVSTTAVVNSSKVEEVKSPFGDLLVQVTKDSTVKNIAVEKPLPPPVIKKEEAVKPVVDSITAKVDKQQEKPVIKSAQKENKSDLKTANLNESKKTDSVFAVAKVEDRPLTQGINKADEMHTDTLKSEITNEIKPIVKTKEVSTQSEIITPRAAISLFATNENTESYDYIYIAEEKTGEKDTINLSIRKEKIEIKPLVINQERNKDSIKSSSKEEPKFIDIIVDTSKKASVPAIIELIKKDSIAKGVDSNAIGQQLEKIVEKEKPIEELKIEKVPEKEIIKESSKVIMVNSDCKNMATEKDFMGLRKKMVAEENDDDMVSAARKIFKTRCFTTDQVKNLCVLFLKDNGRYKFLDAAYPYVYDTDNFKQLSSLLTEEYYINRFRAMIKN